MPAASCTSHLESSSLPDHLQPVYFNLQDPKTKKVVLLRLLSHCVRSNFYTKICFSGSPLTNILGKEGSKYFPPPSLLDCMTWLLLILSATQLFSCLGECMSVSQEAESSGHMGQAPNRAVTDLVTKPEQWAEKQIQVWMEYPVENQIR